ATHASIRATSPTTSPTCPSWRCPSCLARRCTASSTANTPPPTTTRSSTSMHCRRSPNAARGACARSSRHRAPAPDESTAFERTQQLQRHPDLVYFPRDEGIGRDVDALEALHPPWHRHARPRHVDFPASVLPRLPHAVDAEADGHPQRPERLVRSLSVSRWVELPAAC